VDQLQVGVGRRGEGQQVVVVKDLGRPQQ